MNSNLVQSNLPFNFLVLDDDKWNTLIFHKLSMQLEQFHTFFFGFQEALILLYN